MKYIFYIVFLVTTSVFAQEPILLKGKIEADSLMQASVHIVNLTQKTGTVNDEDGFFQMNVMENDTLMFSSVQYKIIEIVLTDEILEQDLLRINLVTNINELDEVKISDVNLSGNLERDLSEIEIVDPTAFGMTWPGTNPPPTPATRKLYTATSANVDLLLNALSGRLKMLERNKANEDLSLLVEKGVHSLPEKFFLQDLNLPEEEIVNFIFYLAETDPNYQKLLLANQDLELLEYYQAKISEFKKMRKAETGN